MMLRKTLLTCIYCIICVNATRDFNEIEECKTKICIPKCCPLGTYVHKGKTCRRPDSYIENALDFSKVPVYSEDRSRIVTNLSDQKFHLVPNAFEDTEFKEEAYDISSAPTHRLYLTETNMFYVEHMNCYKRWRPRNTSKYCVDYRNLKPKEGSNQPRAEYRFFVVLDSEPQQETRAIYRIALMVSSIFLVLVLVVYAVLPDLRNLGGMILMAYVASLLCGFCSLTVILQNVQYKKTTCIGLTMFIYYSLLASFCWMNIMSYDIWWTFRGYAKARFINRRGEIFKFIMYCLYGFGVPLGLTILLAVMHYTDFSLHSWVVKPQLTVYGCFMGGPEKMIYLYMPMLILIICNWAFFLMTAFNVWRLSRGTAVLDSAAAGNPQAHRTQRHRLMVYLKLSIVMGINWVLEIISDQLPELQIFKISDIYNALVGFFIFLIFVFKRKIFYMLLKKFPSKKRWTPGKSKSYTTDSSNSDGSSQETSLPLVCPVPKGPVDKNTSS